MDLLINPSAVKHPSSAVLLRYVKENADDLKLSDAVVHYEFPIYRGEDGDTVTIRLLIMSPRHGVVVIGASNATPSDADLELTRCSEQLDESYTAIFARAIRNRSLRKDVKTLRFSLEAIIFAPFLEDHSSPDELSTPVLRTEEAIREFFNEIEVPELPGRVFDEIVASIEGSKALPRPKKRNIDSLPASSKGFLAHKAELEICRFDMGQKHACVPVLDGPQRIRGLAGSGKTIVLAMKAALTHLKEPDATIVYTFHTKSLYQLIKRLITRFYRQYDDRDPDWSRVKIMHGWGGASTPGVYYEATKVYESPFYSFREAKLESRDAPFDHACKKFLESNPSKPIWDYIFVDEGQDFPSSFISLCHKLAKKGRVLWAYDDLQTIFQAQAPTPGDIFGVKEDGSLKADLTLDHVLHKCYRNPREILVCAHALGFGLYSTHYVQMLENKEHWEDIGYRLKEGELKRGEAVVIERPPENSLTSISDSSGIDEIVQARAFSSPAEEAKYVAESIKRDLADALRPDDILVVTVDDRYAKQYLTSVAKALRALRIPSHNIHTDVFGLTDFHEEGCVTLSTVHKAKGNEAFMVYIVGVDFLFHAVTIRTRNMLFAAMTRAKGWVRLSGTGPSDSPWIKEIEKAKSNFPNLSFIYRDSAEVRVMKRDLEARASKRLSTERKIEDLLEGMTRQELLEYLNKKEIEGREKKPGLGKKRPRRK